MHCYESEKLAEHVIDSDFDRTNVAVLGFCSIATHTPTFHHTVFSLETPLI